MIKLKVFIDGKEKELTFRNPSKLVYSKGYEKVQEKDYFGAADVIVKNCLVEELEESDFERSLVAISNRILMEFFKFSEIKVVDDYKTKSKEYVKLKATHPTIITVLVGEDADAIYFKPLSRFDYKEIYNLSFLSNIQALDYIFDKLMIGGKDITKDVKTYLSCIKIIDYLLAYKNKAVEKK